MHLHLLKHVKACIIIRLSFLLRNKEEYFNEKENFSNRFESLRGFSANSEIKS